MSTNTADQFNQLPEDSKHEQKRRTEFANLDEKLAYDAANLLSKARETYRRDIVTVQEALDLRVRKDDDPEPLRRAIALEIRKEPETNLEAAQIKWVKERIEEGYENSELTLKSQLSQSDAAFPDKEVLTKNVLAGLTREHVEFMMRKDVAPFGFKIKPVCNSLTRLRSLVDRQPQTMSIPDGQKQQPLSMCGPVEKHLQPKPAIDDKITGFKWEFGQDQQIIEPFEGDDLSKTLEEREQLFRNWLPEGMEGTDDASWAMMMADGLRRGQPLDCKFPNDATNTTEYEKWLFTILDKKSYLTENKVRCLGGGSFSPGYRRARLDDYYADDRGVDARFRASVSGLVES